MKELFSKVLHYVPFPAAAKNLVVSELPPSSRQHHDLSRRIGKLSKSKNIKNNLQHYHSNPPPLWEGLGVGSSAHLLTSSQRYHSNSHPLGRGWGWALSRTPRT